MSHSEKCPDPTSEQEADAKKLSVNLMEEPSDNWPIIAAFLAARDARLLSEHEAALAKAEEARDQAVRALGEEGRLRGKAEAENAALRDRVAGLVAALKKIGALCKREKDYWRIQDRGGNTYPVALVEFLKEIDPFLSTDDSLHLLQARLAEERRPLVEALKHCLEHGGCPLCFKNEKHYPDECENPSLKSYIDALLAQYQEESQ